MLATETKGIDRLSFEKIFYFPDHLASLVASEEAYPIHMQLGPVNFCNHDCTFCYAARTMFDAKNTARTRIEVDRLLEVVEEMHGLGLRAVSLVGAGEPTLHPQISDIIRGISERGVEVGMFTNGSCITEKTAQAIAECCTFVRFSLTGATPAVHDLVHANGDFDRVIENIKRVVDARGDTLPTLGSQFVLASYSAPDVVKGAALAKSLGLDYFEIKPCYVAPNKPNQLENTLSWQDACELMREAKTYENDSFRVYAKEEQAEAVFAGPSPRMYDDCPGHKTTAVLEADFELYLCVNQKIPENSFGNLANHSFKEVWQSDQKLEVLKKLNVHDCVANCRQHPLNNIVQEIRVGSRIIPMNLPAAEPEMHKNFL